MVLGFVKASIAELIREDDLKKIDLDFSFIENSKMDEDKFFNLLEMIEVEMQVHLIDVAWKFETVKQLVNYINSHK